MAKKKVEVPDVEAEVVDAEAEVADVDAAAAATLAVEGKRDVDGELVDVPYDEMDPEHLSDYVCLEGHGYQKVGADVARQRRLSFPQLGGNFEHVSEDRYGRWVYRQM